MTYRVEDKKWIFYRHTNNLDIITAVAVNLKNYSKTLISSDKKADLAKKLKELDFYKERNPSMPLDAINHKINTLAYFMFGYKDKIHGEKRFLFSPLGNLFLKHIGDKERISKIFLTMLWSIQNPHPHGGTHNSFQLYPFRLVFKLLTDKRLDCKLYAHEMADLVVYVKDINEEKYEILVNEILTLRQLSDPELIIKFTKKPHAFVNAIYEWDYYICNVLKIAGIISIDKGRTLTRMKHGKNTWRYVRATSVEIKSDILEYCLKLMDKYPYNQEPLKLDNGNRLNIDIIKEIYSFYPKILLREIGELDEDNDLLSELLELPKLIEKYSNNNEEGQAYLFEDVLVEGFNMFYNVEAKGIGGAGNTDIECLYLTEYRKFAVDAKSTKNKLSNINAGRLTAHRKKIGGDYTIVITPRYVPAVKNDIIDTPIVIITANTFSEYLYNCIYNDIREIDYSEFDNIIKDNLGTDISSLISNHTIEKFSGNYQPE